MDNRPKTPEEYVSLVASQDARLLPFKSLFATINRTHKQGLNVDEN